MLDEPVLWQIKAAGSVATSRIDNGRLVNKTMVSVCFFRCGIEFSATLTRIWQVFREKSGNDIRIEQETLNYRPRNEVLEIVASGLSILC